MSAVQSTTGQRLCVAWKEDGSQCSAWAVAGSVYCHAHGGRRSLSNEEIRELALSRKWSYARIARHLGMSQSRVKQIVHPERK